MPKKRGQAEKMEESWPAKDADREIAIPPSGELGKID
jgi:hypothetical protein